MNKTKRLEQTVWHSKLEKTSRMFAMAPMNKFCLWIWCQGRFFQWPSGVAKQAVDRWTSQTCEANIIPQPHSWFGQCKEDVVVCRKLHNGIIHLSVYFHFGAFFCVSFIIYHHHISSIWTKVLNLYLILKKLKKTSSFAALSSRSGWDTKLGWFCSQGNVPDATSSCEMSLDVENVLIEIRLTRNYVLITWYLFTHKTSWMFEP